MKKSRLIVIAIILLLLIIIGTCDSGSTVVEISGTTGTILITDTIYGKSSIKSAGTVIAMRVHELAKENPEIEDIRVEFIAKYENTYGEDKEKIITFHESDLTEVRRYKDSLDYAVATGYLYSFSISNKFLW